VKGVFAGAALILSGCAVGPNYHTPKPDTPPAFVTRAPTSPEASATSAAPAAAPDLARWWHALNDPQLDTLVERAIKSNLDLEIALTRLQEARYYEAVVAGHALPEIDASGAAAKGTGTDLTRGRAAQGLVSADNTNGLQHINTVAGFDAVWELDLFGKYRREFQAARYDRLAAEAARSAVVTSLIADVVQAYIDLRGSQMRVGILRSASDVLRESLRIVNIRYERGIINELDVELATRELNTLEAQIPPLDAQVSATEYALATLLGEYPEKITNELSTPTLIPTVPAPVAPGAPLDLLKRRPDIQQAEHELAAATARIGVATANLFPQVALVGAIGSQSQGLGTQPGISKHIWSFGPSALWPLLDFGALDAQVNIAELRTHADLMIYRKTILSAVQQVDTALDGYTAQQDRLKYLGDAMVAAQRAVELANARYNRGLSDFLNVVDAERQLYDLQDQYAAAQVSQGEQFVQLYKSLGGGWQGYQEIPAIRLPQPAIVAAFRRVLTGSAL
jgi:NodT family efflux transporter outer membrane factor (OMF) lipoprotein